MSTIIIITPPPTKPTQREAVETTQGAEVIENGQTLASFTGPNAYDNAIKYLKVMKG